ncbi:hypothetical protein BB561_004356 [Smittium simulii]|uniref:Bromo domain-containing protein n=1 Tax=Smittium simulii TaxID=133385 RepID=A0A2T9YGR7_9FUNG|nr:hypothetical protein BB561_004356 [Smittium simulii]
MINTFCTNSHEKSSQDFSPSPTASLNRSPNTKHNDLNTTKDVLKTAPNFSHTPIISKIKLFSSKTQPQTPCNTGTPSGVIENSISLSDIPSGIIEKSTCLSDSLQTPIKSFKIALKINSKVVNITTPINPFLTSSKTSFKAKPRIIHLNLKPQENSQKNNKANSQTSQKKKNSSASKVAKSIPQPQILPITSNYTEETSAKEDPNIDPEVYTFNFLSKDIYSPLSRLLKKLFRKDSYAMFWEPVKTDLVTDYLDVVKDPMDLGTMKTNLEAGIYTSFSLFIAHFDLICSNAMTYNNSSTIYYQHALKFLEAGKAAIAKTAKKLSRIKQMLYSSSEAHSLNNLPGEKHKAEQILNNESDGTKKIDIRPLPPVELPITESNSFSDLNNQKLDIIDTNTEPSSSTTPKISTLTFTKSSYIELSENNNSALSSIKKNKIFDHFNIHENHTKRLKTSKASSSKRSKQKIEKFHKAHSIAPNSTFAYLQYVDKTQIFSDGSIDFQCSPVLESILSNYENYYSGFSFDPLICDSSKPLVIADNWRLLRDSDFANFEIYSNDQLPILKQRTQDISPIDIVSNDFGLESVFSDKQGLAYYISVIEFLGVNNSLSKQYIKNVFNYLSNGAYNLCLETQKRLYSTLYSESDVGKPVLISEEKR